LSSDKPIAASTSEKKTLFSSHESFEPFTSPSPSHIKPRTATYPRPKELLQKSHWRYPLMIPG
jgi:hypothetical protein